MRAIMGCLLLVGSAGLMLSGLCGVRADEEKVPLDKLPKVVLEAMKKRFPKGELIEATKETVDGKTEYEVAVKDGGHKFDVTLTSEGAITLMEKEIAATELPKAVKEALDKKYPKATFTLIEEVIEVKDGKETLDFYEVKLETADKNKVEVKVGPDGKIKSDGQEEGELGAWTSDFSADKDTLTSTGKNPYFILEPGYQLVLEGGNEQLTITVLNETKTVDGVECRVVEERETKDGKVVEVSRNYFAISKRTNSVYYFGEDTGGAWLSGEKGARYGLMMPGLPLLKAKFYQEIAPKVAMDRAEIIGLGLAVKTPAGEFKDCLKFEETTPLEPGTKEYKLYAPGVGLVQENQLKLVKYGKVELPKK